MWRIAFDTYMNIAVAGEEVRKEERILLGKDLVKLWLGHNLGKTDMTHAYGRFSEYMKEKILERHYMITNEIR